MGQDFALRTNDTRLCARNGQRVTVLREIAEPDDAHDAESLPMLAVRFDDGFEAEVWGDELRP